MKKFSLIALIAIATLVGCKKKSTAPEPTAVLELAAVPEFVDDQLKPTDGVVIARFDGELTDDDERQKEDNSRVDIHPIELTEGEWIHAVMWGDGFDTFLMFEPPGERGWFFNDDCESVSNTASCMRFQVPVTGTYNLRANAFDDRGKGAYLVYVYRVPGSGAPERSSGEPAPADEANTDNAEAPTAE